MLAKTMASSCSCPKNVDKDEFKDDGLICLDVSRQDGFQTGEEEAAVTKKSVDQHHHRRVSCTALGEWKVS